MPIREVKIPVGVDDRTGRGLKNIESKFSRFAKAGLASVATAAAAGTTALVGLTRAATKSADEIGKLSLQLGISVKALSELKFIGEQTGVGFNALSISMQRSTRRISEAANGTGEAVKALDELGLSAQRLNQLAPDQQFEILAKALAGVTSETDQVRLAFKFFDSEGVRLLRTIKQTGGDFSALRGEAKNLGAVMDEELTGKAAGVNDAMNRIKTAGQGLGNAFLNTLAPAIISTANAFTAAVNASRKLLENLGLLKSVDDRDRLVQITEELADLDERRAVIASRTGLSAISNEETLKKLDEERNALLQERAEIAQRIIDLTSQGATSEQATLQGVGLAPGASNSTGGFGGEESETPAARRLREAMELFEQEKQFLEDAAQFRIDTEQYVTDKLADLAQRQAATQQKYDQLMVQSKLSLARQAVNAFQFLANGSQKWAKVLLAIDVGLGIAQALINSQVAATRALRDLGPIAGPPVAAKMLAFGQLSAGIIAAAGVLRLAGAGGGVGGGSVPAPATRAAQDPFAVPDDFNISDATRPASNIINIDFRPGITDSAAVRDFIENDFAEALRDGAGLNVQVVAR